MQVTSPLELQPAIVETVAITETILQSRGFSCNHHYKNLPRETVT